MLMTKSGARGKQDQLEKLFLFSYALRPLFLRSQMKEDEIEVRTQYTIITCRALPRPQKFSGMLLRGWLELQINPAKDKLKGQQSTIKPVCAFEISPLQC